MIAAIYRCSILLAGTDLLGALGSRPDASRAAARRREARAAFGGIDDLVASEANVVHVCSPNATHARPSAASTQTASFDGVLSVEHEDPLWGGTEIKILQGLTVAQQALRPLIIPDSN